MTGSRVALWGLWALFLALLALELALPELLPARPQAWYDAQVSVAGFVLTLLAILAAVGTFTLRETLVGRDVRAGTLDPRTPAGYARVRLMLLALWTLCLLIGLLGVGLAYGAASARLALPYTFGAAGLLAWHAPRRWLFRSPQPQAGRAGAAPDAS
jgi:hypothetical protein